MNEYNNRHKSFTRRNIIKSSKLKANNTIRAYKSDFNDFGLFCAQNGFKSLPSEPKVVSLYLNSFINKRC